MEPKFPDAEICMDEFVAKGAVYHMMMQACGELRRAGATEEQIEEYRVEAINDGPWTVTPRWVTVG